MVIGVPLRLVTRFEWPPSSPCLSSSVPPFRGRVDLKRSRGGPEIPRPSGVPRVFPNLAKDCDSESYIFSGQLEWLKRAVEDPGLLTVRVHVPVNTGGVRSTWETRQFGPCFMAEYTSLDERLGRGVIKAQFLSLLPRSMAPFELGWLWVIIIAWWLDWGWAVFEVWLCLEFRVNLLGFESF